MFVCICIPLCLFVSVRLDLLDALQLQQRLEQATKQHREQTNALYPVGETQLETIKNSQQINRKLRELPVNTIEMLLLYNRICLPLKVYKMLHATGCKFFLR